MESLCHTLTMQAPEAQGPGVQGPGARWEGQGGLCALHSLQTSVSLQRVMAGDQLTASV